jgi:demethylmenaquinone methyltransferase/2-methoxy-6-polyprenyl-1,4-benzoquinol methylase
VLREWLEFLMIRIEGRVLLTGGVCDVRRLAFQIGEQMARNPPPDTHGKRQAVELFSGLPSHYDRLSSWLSFGQDPRWRRALVTALAPAPGARVLDVATGTGMVAAELLARCGDCSVVGVDQSEQMLGAARARFAGDRRVELLQGEAEALPFAEESFDLLTFTYLLRYVEDPAATLRELARVVRPGGRVCSLEFGVPPWLPARAAWRFYTAVGLPTLGRIASREWMEVGRFLGPSIRGYYARHPLEQIVGYWTAAGFDDVVVRRMSLGGGVVMSGVKAQRSSGAATAGAVVDSATAGGASDARGA